MAYAKYTWVDRNVATPRKFTKTLETSGSVTLTPDPGVITAAGTPSNATRMNALEDGLEAAALIADAALPKAGGTMTGPTTLAAKGVAANTWSNQIILKYIDSGGVERSRIIEMGSDGKLFKTTLSVANYEIWSEEKIRFTSGYPEWNDGGTWKGIGGVKIVHYGTATLLGNVNSVDITLPSAVVLAKAKTNITFKGFPAATGVDPVYSVAYNTLRGRLTSTTNLQIDRAGNPGTTPTYDISIAYEVSEDY